jgi:hypothetical protein
MGGAIMAHFTITYDIVTPESAADGGFAESGFYGMIR